MFIPSYYPQQFGQFTHQAAPVQPQAQHLQSTVIPSHQQQQQHMASQTMVAQQQFQQTTSVQQQASYAMQFQQQSGYMPMFSYPSTGAAPPTYVTPTVEPSGVGVNTTNVPTTALGSTVDSSAAYYQQQVLAAWAQNGPPSIYYQQPIYTAMTSPHLVAREQRNNAIMKQIESYLSPTALKSDMELRKKMDTEGYIPLTVIAGLPRVQQITNDILLIIRILQRSTELELDADCVKVRPRADWHLYPLALKSANRKRENPTPKTKNVDQKPATGDDAK